MKATKPLCAKAVTPINAIKNIIIGNMKNFLRLTYNSKISLIVEIFEKNQSFDQNEYVVIIIS